MKTAPLVLTLDNREKALLERMISDIPYPREHYAPYIAEIRQRIPLLMTLFAKIQTFCDEQIDLAQRPCAIKIENLPVDRDLPIPDAGAGSVKHISKNTYLSENTLTLIGNMFGYAYSMHYEGKGLINNLIPAKETTAQVTGLGAASDLRFHIENAALRFLGNGRDCSPSALFLLGIRQEARPPKTRLSDARLALRLLSPETKALLSELNYKIKLPYRWRTEDESCAEAETAYIPLLQVMPSGFAIHAAFYGDMIIDIRTEAAERAAKEFESALEEVALDEVVAPGVLLGIDNKITLHARTPFEASFDDRGRAQRWVQRLFVTTSLDNFTGWAMTDSNVYAPKHMAMVRSSSAGPMH